MTLGMLSILAAESAGEGEESFFAGIASSWNEGGWPMYPIALVFVVGLAISVERLIEPCARAMGRALGRRFALRAVAESGLAVLLSEAELHPERSQPLNG